MSNSTLAHLVIMALLNDFETPTSEPNDTPNAECPCDNCALQRANSLDDMREYLKSRRLSDTRSSKLEELSDILQRATTADTSTSDYEKERRYFHKYPTMADDDTRPNAYPTFPRANDSTRETTQYNALNLKISRNLDISRHLIEDVAMLDRQLKTVIKNTFLDIAGKQAETDAKVDRILQLLESKVSDGDEPVLEEVVKDEDEYVTVDLRRKVGSVDPDQPRPPQFYVEEVVNDEDTIMPIRRLIKPKKTNKQLKMFLEMLMNLSYQSYGTEFVVSEDILNEVIKRNTSHTIEGTSQRVLIANTADGTVVIVHENSTYEITNVFMLSAVDDDVSFRKIAITPSVIDVIRHIPNTLMYT